LATIGFHWLTSIDYLRLLGNWCPPDSCHLEAIWLIIFASTLVFLGNRMSQAYSICISGKNKFWLWLKLHFFSIKKFGCWSVSWVQIYPKFSSFDSKFQKWLKRKDHLLGKAENTNTYVLWKWKWRVRSNLFFFLLRFFHFIKSKVYEDFHYENLSTR
jgi:hypothetical protein